MESRTEVAYKAVLELIRHVLGPNIALTRVIGDFEAAQQNAWEETFGVMVQGCLWHLCRVNNFLFFLTHCTYGLH